VRGLPVLAIVIALSAASIVSAILLRPSDFETCLKIISADIDRQGGSATLDPKDVEAQAARICLGYEAR
jgi:hypothetical protein